MISYLSGSNLTPESQFGEILATVKLREGAFLSRAELGAKSGVHPDHIGRFERGDWKGGMRIDNIRKLAEALGVDPADLVEH